MPDPARTYLSVASNIDPEPNILEALAQLATHMPITAVSTFYRTAALARPEQDDYLNGVVRVACTCAPRTLKFDVLRLIEDALGRVRSADKYAARPIDLDILACGSLVIGEPDLTIPDPDLRQRDFLAVALLELEPGFVLPDTGQALADLFPPGQERLLDPAQQFTHLLKERLSL